jgi:hypothetical protein
MDWLIPMRALAHPTLEQGRFYRAHAKSRRVVECSFGLLKNRFCCLEKLRVKDPILACEIIKACTVLHNLALKSQPIDLNDELDRLDRRFDAAGARLNALGLESEASSDEEDDAPIAPAAQTRVQQLIQSFVSINY